MAKDLLLAGLSAANLAADGPTVSILGKAVEESLLLPPILSVGSRISSALGGDASALG